MQLSQKMKYRLMMPFAISPIMKWCALPGIIGMVALTIGFVQKIRWLEIVGVALAAPMFWVYFVIVFFFMPYLIFDKIRKGRKKAR